MSTTPVPPQAQDSSQASRTAGSAAQSQHERRRALLGSGIGNALEWYDWHVYGIFAPFFAKQFFNPTNSLSALLSTLAVFAVGFAMRPVGGFLFGWIADRKGRRLSMVASISVGAAGSLLIGIAPTYASIGVGASVLLLLARLTQGLAHGGELPSAMTYLAETAPPEKRGRWTSAVFASGAVGIVVATLLGAGLAAFYGDDAMAAWAWRIPFIVGGLVGFYGLYLRRGLAETHSFEHEQAEKTAPGKRKSVLRGVWENKGAAGRVIGITLSAAVVYQTWTVTVPAYAIGVQKLDSAGVLLYEVIALLIFIAALPVCGAISDKIGRKKNMLIFGIGMAVLSYPLAGLARGGELWQLFVAMVIALIFIAMCVSILPALFSELFPTRVRATGTGLPYAIAVALSGGTAPYLMTWLASKNLQNYFTGYAIVLLLIGIAVIVATPETRGKTLE